MIILHCWGKKSMLLLAGIFINLFLYAQLGTDFIPYRSGSLWGYADSTGKILITPRYDSVNFFENEYSYIHNSGKSLAIVRKGLLGVIDKEGNFILPCEYEKISINSYRYYFDSVANNWMNTNEPTIELVKNGNRYHYLIFQQQLIPQKSFLSDNATYEELREVKMLLPTGFYCNVGKTMDINPAGNDSFYVYKKVCIQAYDSSAVAPQPHYIYKQTTDTAIIPALQLLKLDSWHELLLIKKETGWGIISFSGNMFVESVYDTIIRSGQGYMLAAKKDRKWYVFSLNADHIKWAINSYDSVRNNGYNGDFIIKRKKRWGILISDLRREVLVDKNLYGNYRMLAGKMIEIRDRKDKLVGYYFLNGTKLWHK